MSEPANRNHPDANPENRPASVMPTPSGGGRRATNALLAVIAGVLVFQTADRLSVFEPAPAQAQDNRSGGLISAAAQRQEIIRDIKAISTRLTSIEKRLEGELRVRVTDMPEIKFPREAEKKD